MSEALEQEWAVNETDLTPAGGGPVVTVAHRYGMWPKQAQFHRTRKKYVVYGGARGPGKTVALVEAIQTKMWRWPKEWYDPKFGGQYHKGENWIRFPNGSTCQLGELKDWESYKSATVGLIAIDELSEVEEDAYLNMAPTLRWTTGAGICKYAECAALGAEFAREHPEHPFYQILAATNPAPGWVKTRFWEPWKQGRELPGHAFVSATAFDNPSLPPDFIPTLLENNTMQWVQNYIHGDWSSFEDMVWPRFNRGTHLWRGPLPKFVDVQGGIDYGGTTQDAHRTCFYLTGQTEQGQFITFKEYSKQGAASKDFFVQYKLAHSHYRVSRSEGDASQHRSNEHFRRADIKVDDAPRYKGAVRDGINEIDRLLTVDETKRPQLYVTEDCPRLLSGIESYQLDPETGEPKKNQDDDEVNAWRYNIMAISKARGRGGERDWKANTLHDSRRSPHSSIITAMRADRTARMKAVIAAMEKGA